MNKKRRPVTMAEVARAAGVSPATVSLVLRGKKGFAAETRQLVMGTLARLGYVYNRAAARLRTSRSRIVGLIVPNLTNPFFAQLTTSVEEALDGAGLTLILAQSSESIERQERALAAMRENGVDGILLCPAHGTTAKQLAKHARVEAPLVLFTRSVAGCAADYVGSDNAAGARAATEYLLGLGHLRIAFLGGNPNSVVRGERLDGYRAALAASGLAGDEGLVLLGDVSVDGGFRAVSRALENTAPPSAAVCFNDVVAFGVILGLWSAGVVPGRDFAVVGFDNLIEASLWRPALTTVSLTPGRIGAEAARLLLERMGAPGRKPIRRVLTPSLMKRASCGEIATAP